MPRGRSFEAALRQARMRGVVTDDLRQAFDDRAVAFARNWELVTMFLIIVLMVTKPF